MFEMNRLLDRRVVITLQLPSEEVKTFLQSVDHQKFVAGWQRWFPISPDNTTTRAGVFWLSRWCLNGGSSSRYAAQCQDIFNGIFPFTYQRFRDAGLDEDFVCRARYY
jgi:hypothetical protein